MFVGLFTPRKSSLPWAFLGALFFFLDSLGVYAAFGMLELLIAPNTVTGEIRTLELEWPVTLVVIGIKAFIATGLSEEILFRGLIGKRLIAKLGFYGGNLLQAIIFGVLHGVLIYNHTTVGAALLISLVTGAVGYYLGYLNERIGNGSIVPSWIAHGFGNVIAFSYIVFAL